VLAGFTMVSGVLGAVSQIEVRRLLAFHIISQIGYMIMGLAFMTPLGLAGAVFHAIHNIIAKSNLFLISGIMYQVHGTYNLKKLGGLYASHPYLSILFLTSAFSLAGIPPLAGFFSKFLLVRAGLEAGHYEIVIIALLVGILTLYSMTKIWAEAFWKPLPASTRAAGEEPRSMDRAAGPHALQLWIPAATLSVLTLALGISAGPYFEFWIRLGEELMNPTAYIQAVLRTES
jgi:multicomponent Na+:H+ antiporter subunit D